jgi:ankyrin repeat protein
MKIMKKMFLLLFVICFSAHLFGQGNNIYKNKSTFESVVKSNDIEKLKALDFVDSEFLNFKDFGTKPIAIAIQETGNKEIIDYLIEKGADLKNVDMWNGSALSYIPYYWYMKNRGNYGPDPFRSKICKIRYYKSNPDVEKNIDLAKYLLSKGAELESKNKGQSPWELVVKHNELDILKFYVEYNNNEIPEEMHSVVMMEACDQKNYDIVKYLLEIGVSGNQEDKNNFAALARAADSPEIAKLLLENGAKINKVGYLGTTPIMHAAREGCVEVVKLFIDNGADISIKSNKGYDAIKYAKKFNDKETKDEIITLLKNAK